MTTTTARTPFRGLTKSGPRDRRDHFWCVSAWCILALALASTPPAAATGSSGALFTTDPTGQSVNQNLFDSAADVYISGGPRHGWGGQHGGSRGKKRGLADGVWVFQVTDPSGAELLSLDPAACRIVLVRQGVIRALLDWDGARLSRHHTDDACHIVDGPNGTAGASQRHDLNRVVGGKVVQLAPFGPTPSPGGVYKAWIIPLGAYVGAGGDLDRTPDGSPDPGFSRPRKAKTDNFKIRQQANQAPVADAGANRTASVGATVTLDGSGSFDPDGDPLTYAWSFVDQPTGSTATLDDTTVVRPQLVLDLPGRYELELVVNDGSLSSAPDRVVLETTNSAPVADAGPDATAFLGQTVTLDGSGSSDADGDPLTYAWTVLQRPIGSTASLDDSTVVMPSFTLDVAGSYMFELTVDDGQQSSAPDQVTITTLNTPPVADAGPDQTVPLSNTVMLDGSGSTDVDGDLLTFLWSLTSVPAGSLADLTDPTSISPSFTADVPGDYVAQLIVNDGATDSAPDTVLVSTQNTQPVADAGPDQTVAPGELVTLDGSGSSDADGDPLVFSWALVSVPAGSLATLDDPAAPLPSFTADVSGSYIAQLTVSDVALTSQPDTVTVTAAGNSPPVADAGADQIFFLAFFGGSAQLDGSGSFDVDGDPLTFFWSIVSQPPGSSAFLVGNTSGPDPVLSVGAGPEGRGTYVVQLIVNDGTVDSAPDTVMLDTENVRPVANAGPDQSVALGSTVTLDGSGSSDLDGDPLTFQWSMLSSPPGSAATLSDPSSVMPSFGLDVPGSYVVQLIVNDGTEDSAPDSAVITTLNVPPVADAGPDQSPLAGSVVFLDGTGSSDADGDPLTYLWSFESRPAGSTASLDDPTVAMPSFTVDQPGTYQVQLIVNDGEDSSLPDSVLVSTSGSRPVADAGPDQTVGQGATVLLDGTGSSDADGDPLQFFWSIMAAPQGSTATLDDPASALPTFTADLPGLYLVQLIVNDGTNDSNPDSVVVDAVASNDLRLVLDSPLVGLGRTIGGNVFLGAPAPAGGVLVTLTSDNASIAGITPPQTLIAQGDSSAPVTVSGDALGNTVLRATAPGFNPGAAPIEVTSSVVSIDNLLVVAPGETQGLAVSLTTPAPTGGTTIYFDSADPSIATISPQVFVPAGDVLPVSNPQVTGGVLGQTLVTATAAGFAPDTRPITTTVTLSLEPDPFTIGIEARQMTLRLSDPAPAGGLTFAMVSEFPSVATVQATVQIAAGQITAPVPVTGLAFGSTEVRGSTPGLPDVTATLVVDDRISMSPGEPNRVGRDLQRLRSAILQADAGPGGATMTITSGNPALLLVSDDVDTPGSASITVGIAPGDNVGRAFLQALSDTGTVDVTYSVPGRRDATASISLRPSMIACTLGGFGQCPTNLTVTTLASSSEREIGRLRAFELDSSGTTVVELGALRAGLDVQVQVTSSDPSVVTAPSPLTLRGGTGIGDLVTIDPVAPGMATVNLVQPPGFTSVPSWASSFDVTVELPEVRVSPPPQPFIQGRSLIGQGLQVQGAASFTDLPPGPTDMTVTVDDPTVAVVSADILIAGSATLILPDPGQPGSRLFQIQGLSPGTTTLRVNAPGFGEGSLDLEVVPSGFGNAFQAITLQTFSPPTSMRIHPVLIRPDTGTIAIQPLGPQGPVSVAVQSSDASIALVAPASVTFAPGDDTQMVDLTGVSGGMANVTVHQPAGFALPDQVLDVTVGAPDLILDQLVNVIGRDLQVTPRLRLESFQSPVTVTLTVDDPAVAVVARNLTLPGGPSTTVQFNSFSPTNISVQGLSLGTTTLRASAPGYNPLSVPLTVVEGGFRHDLGTTLSLTTFDADQPLTVTPVALDFTADLAFGGQRVRPGLQLDVGVVSSSPGVAAVTQSPLSFGPTNLSLQTEIDPLVAGSTVIDIVQPPGFVRPVIIGGVDRSRTDVTVAAPDIQLSGQVNYGLNLQGEVNVLLEAAPPQPVDITITTTAPGIARISTDPAVAGSTSITFSGVTTTAVGSLWVEGLSLGGAQLIAQGSGFDDDTLDVNVLPSGFVHRTPFNPPRDVVTTVSAANTNLSIGPVALDPTTLQVATSQPAHRLRVGLAVDVVITSSSPGVASVVGSPVQLISGDSVGSYQVDPAAVGSTVLSVATPAGFSTPSELVLRTVIVDP